MRFQAQQGAVIQSAHPARVAAGASRVLRQQGIDIHEWGLARPGEEQAHGLHFGRAGQQWPEHVLAGGMQFINSADEYIWDDAMAAAEEFNQHGGYARCFGISSRFLRNIRTGPVPLLNADEN